MSRKSTNTRARGLAASCCMAPMVFGSDRSDCGPARAHDARARMPESIAASRLRGRRSPRRADRARACPPASGTRPPGRSWPRCGTWAAVADPGVSRPRPIAHRDVAAAARTRARDAKRRLLCTASILSGMRGVAGHRSLRHFGGRVRAEGKSPMHALQSRPSENQPPAGRAGIRPGPKLFNLRTNRRSPRKGPHGRALASNRTFPDRRAP